MARLLALLCMLSLTAGVFASGKIYTWTDEAGVVHYGDRPPLTVEAKELAVQGTRTAPVEVERGQLVGTWFGSSNNGSELKVTFDQSGSMVYTQTREDTSVLNYQAIWTLNDRSITVITEFTQEVAPNGTVTRSVEPVQLGYNVIRFSDESMEIIAGQDRFILARQ